MNLPPPDALDPDLPRIWIQPHYRSFNGLRAVAVFSVFLAHYAIFWGVELSHTFFWTGVDLFFVLSGFLITGILYDSLEGPRYFRNFYIRRALRIFPVFYGFFFLLFLLTPLLHLVYSPTLLTFCFYVGNLYVPFGLLQNINATSVSVLRHGSPVEVLNLGHLWSLCIEEQFYMLWPAAIFLIRDRRRLMQLCVVLCVLVLLLRFALYRYYNIYMLAYTNTFTRCDTLLVGAFLALWLRGNPLSLRQLRRISSALFWLPTLVIVFMVLRLYRVNPALLNNSRFINTLGFTLVALAYAGLVLRSLDDSSRVSRLLRLWPLHALGVISYGFYLIHLLPEDLLTLLVAHRPHWAPFAPLLAFAGTIAAASLSFRYLETPFLRLKRILAPQPAASDAATPAHLHVSEPAA